MNTIINPEIKTWETIDLNELTMTYPWWWVWSRKAIQELLKQLNDIWCVSAKKILEENPNIQQAWNPTELAKALSEHIPSWIVLLPIYNQYGWNVTWTLIAIMDYYEKNWVMPRILGNVEVEIEHCLCGKPLQTPREIAEWTIYSHWQAIKQCDNKITKYWMKSESVDWTSVKLEEAKQNKWVFLLLDRGTAKKNWLEIYDWQMWPKNNHTSFAVITSDPNIELPKINWNEDINVWIIKADNHHWWLLLSLLPLILTDETVDMKAITSKLNWNNPMIWIIWKWWMFDKTSDTYKHLTWNETKNPWKMTDGTLALLIRKLNIFLKKIYNIKVQKNGWNSYTLISDNKPWALVKMLILLEYNNINLNSINSEVKEGKANITIETDDEIEWISEINMPEWITEYLRYFIWGNIDRIHEIISVWK